MFAATEILHRLRRNPHEEVEPNNTFSDPSKSPSKQDVLLVVAKLLKMRTFVLERFALVELPLSNAFSLSGDYKKLEVAVMIHGIHKEHSFIFKTLDGDDGYSNEKEIRSQALRREIEFYTGIYDDFKKNEKDEIIRWSPLYYLSNPEKFLLLEDLTANGYYQVERRECLDKEHILAVIRALANFHSASIKLEENMNQSKETGKPNFTKKTVANMYEKLELNLASSSSGSDVKNLFIEAGIKSQVNLVDQLPGYSHEEVEKIKGQLPELLRNMSEMGKPSTKYRNVIIHGALSPKNIFFRRNDNKLEAILFNFSMIRYAPPAQDLIMLLHLNQRMMFRIKEKQSLIQTYYNMFSEELGKSGICIQSVLPVKDFLESCEECVGYASIASAMYLQGYLLSDETIQKYLGDLNSYKKNLLRDRTEMITDCFRRDIIYRTRMTEAMNDLIKMNLHLQSNSSVADEDKD